MAAQNRFAITTETLSGGFLNKLAAIKAAGFAGLELFSRDLFERHGSMEGALEALRDSGVKAACFQHLGNYEGSPKDVRDVKLKVAAIIMDQMNMASCDLLIVSSNKAEVPEDWERAADDLRMLGDLAKSKNVRIGYEALSYTPWINTYQKAWKMVEKVNHSHVGLDLDATHTFVPKSPLEPISDIPANKIFLVEVADLPTTNLPLREVSSYYRLFPGEGTQPLAEFIKRTQDIGYSGYYSVEIFSSHYGLQDPHVVCKRAFDAISKFF